MATIQRRERRQTPGTGTAGRDEVGGGRDATTPEARMRQAVARCLSVMVFYHHDRADTRDPCAPMRGEIRQIAAWVDELGLGSVATDDDLIEPVRVGLIDRFGHEVGARLFAEFTGAFDKEAVTPGADSLRA